MALSVENRPCFPPPVFANHQATSSSLGQNSSLQTRLHMTFTSENYWGVNLLTYLLNAPAGGVSLGIWYRRKGAECCYDGATRSSKSFKTGLVVLIQYRLWQAASQPASQPASHPAAQPRFRSKDAAYYVARVKTLRISLKSANKRQRNACLNYDPSIEQRSGLGALQTKTNTTFSHLQPAHIVRFSPNFACR